jgi:primosomal protein N''
MKTYLITLARAGCFMACILIMLSFSGCKAIRAVNQFFDKKAAETRGARINKTIKDAGENLGQGLMKGIRTDSIQVDGLVDRLLEDLDRILSREMNELKLKGLDAEFAATLKNAFEDPAMRQSLEKLALGLLDGLETDLKNRRFSIQIDPKISQENLQQVLNSLRDSLLSQNTSAGLANTIDMALLKLAAKGGLDSLLGKVNNSVDKSAIGLEKRLDKQTAQIKNMAKRFWTTLIGAILLIAVLLGHHFRKQRQHKKLMALLTQGVDQIKNQQEYDQIRDWINGRASEVGLQKVLGDFVKNHQAEYPNKLKYRDLAQAQDFDQRLLDLLQQNISQEKQSQLMARLKDDVAFSSYVRSRLAFAK